MDLVTFLGSLYDPLRGVLKLISLFVRKSFSLQCENLTWNYTRKLIFMQEDNEKHVYMLICWLLSNCCLRGGLAGVVYMRTKLSVGDGVLEIRNIARRSGLGSGNGMINGWQMKQKQYFVQGLQCRLMAWIVHKETDFFYVALILTLGVKLPYVTVKTGTLVLISCLTLTLLHG